MPIPSISFLFMSKGKLTIGLLLTLLTLNAYSEPYSPPTGIPAPEFGINETVESIYGSDTYYTHYVDASDANATDTNNSNGSPAKPRLTIPTTLAAGSVVEVHGGPYSSPTTLTWQMNGTATAPVFIESLKPRPKDVVLRIQ